jgi:hypothetical protein
MQKILIDRREFVGELRVQMFDDFRIAQHGINSRLLRPKMRTLPRRVEMPRTPALNLALRLDRVVASQTQYRLDAPAALSAAPAGLIHVGRTLTAGRGHGLLHSFVGQRIAQADIHDTASIPTDGMADTLTANASQ